MKTCAYCGKENDDSAAACAECGTNVFKAPDGSLPSPPEISREPSLRFLDHISDAPQLFKTLVILSAGVYTFLTLQPYLGDRFLSGGVWDALAWDGFGALLPLPESISWLLFLLNLAVALGLWNFSKSARLVFTMLAGFYIILSLLSGVYVQTALESFLSYILNLADGAILVMAYTSPIKEKFS